MVKAVRCKKAKNWNNAAHLAEIGNNPKLVRSFFRHPPVTLLIYA